MDSIRLPDVFPMCLLTSSNEFLSIVPLCTFRPRRTNAGGKCFINKIPKTQINNVNIVNEICYKNSVFNFLFDIYCPDFFVAKVWYKVYFKKVKKNSQNFKTPQLSSIFITAEDWFIITENRTQFICIYILEGFYLDSLDIIVVFG